MESTRTWPLHLPTVATDFVAEGMLFDLNCPQHPAHATVVLRPVHPADGYPMFVVTSRDLEALQMLSTVTEFVRSVQIITVQSGDNNHVFRRAWQLRSGTAHGCAETVGTDGRRHECALKGLLDKVAYIDRIDCTSRILNEQSLDFVADD